MNRFWITVLFGVYFSLIIFLAIRPRIPYLYDNVMPSSDIGGFNMYPYLLEQKVDCFAVNERNDTTQIEWSQHFYHGQFANSAHPNYKNFIGERFIDFLLLNNPEIKKFEETNANGKLYLSIALIREKSDTSTYMYVRNITK